MPTTPEYGWRTPANADANDVPLDMATLAGQIEATMKAANVLISQREVTTTAPGWTLVRHGRVRELYIFQTGGSMPVGQTQITGSIAAADRPTISNVWGVASFGTPFTGAAFLTTAGAVYVHNNTGATRTSIQATFTWTV